MFWLCFKSFYYIKMTIKELEEKIEELEYERRDLLQQTYKLEQDIEILKDQISDRDARIIELEKWIEEALADLQYTL